MCSGVFGITHKIFYTHTAGKFHVSFFYLFYLPRYTSEPACCCRTLKDMPWQAKWDNKNAGKLFGKIRETTKATSTCGSFYKNHTTDG